MQRQPRDRMANDISRCRIYICMYIRKPRFEPLRTSTGGTRVSIRKGTGENVMVENERRLRFENERYLAVDVVDVSYIIYRIYR